MKLNVAPLKQPMSVTLRVAVTIAISTFFVGLVGCSTGSNDSSSEAGQLDPLTGGQISPGNSFEYTIRQHRPWNGNGRRSWATADIPRSFPILVFIILQHSKWSGSRQQ